MVGTFYLNSALASAASFSRNASISPSRGEKAPTSAAAFRADSISILLMLLSHTCSGKMSIPTKVSRAHLQNCREGNLTRNFWYGKTLLSKWFLLPRKTLGNESFFRPVFLVLLHLPNFPFLGRKSPGCFQRKQDFFFQPQTRRADGTWKKHGVFSPEIFFSALNEIWVFKNFWVGRMRHCAVCTRGREKDGKKFPLCSSRIGARERTENFSFS